MSLNTNDLSLQRPTWAEIDLDALRSNFVKIQQRVAPAKILAVVKSDAYGHGATVVARELEEAGASFLGTATVAEAIQLRRASIRLPILVLSGMTPEQIPLLQEFDFIPAVYNREVLNALGTYAEATGRPVAVHLKVNTGMGRLGFTPDDATQILHSPPRGVKIEGLFTHFATAEITDDAYTQLQLTHFRKLLDTSGAAGILIHSANSAALLNYADSHFDLVRPGLLLYGISPTDDPLDFEPVLSLKSRIIFLHWIHKGETIGYGRTFQADKDTLIATIPIGYADGLRRLLSNRLQVEVSGAMCKIAGTISMDLCTIDVTPVAEHAKLYEEVTLIGPKTPATEWAKFLHTVPYEITCLIGSRVPRVYFKAGKIVDVYYP